MDRLTFDKENRDRIHAVDVSFGPAGAPLSKPGRVLMGQGRLVKQGRRKLQAKDFFLFNDVLVYGRVILNGRWRSNQKVIPLGERHRNYMSVFISICLLLTSSPIHIIQTANPCDLGLTLDRSPGHT